MTLVSYLVVYLQITVVSLAISVAAGTIVFMLDRRVVILAILFPPKPPKARLISRKGRHDRSNR